MNITIDGAVELIKKRVHETTYVVMHGKIEDGVMKRVYLINYTGGMTDAEEADFRKAATCGDFEDIAICNSQKTIAKVVLGDLLTRVNAFLANCDKRSNKHNRVGVALFPRVISMRYLAEIVRRDYNGMSQSDEDELRAMMTGGNYTEARAYSDNGVFAICDL